jgi:hypothetical protein
MHIDTIPTAVAFEIVYTVYTLRNGMIYIYLQYPPNGSLGHFSLTVLDLTLTMIVL